MNYKKSFGNCGEDIACQYLEDNNYEIIDRNFRCNQGEIDIVAKDIEKNELVFVEVKARTNYNFGVPAQAVNQIKQKHLFNATNYYIYKNNLYKSFIRFDIIEVYAQKFSYKINHLKNIFK